MPVLGSVPDDAVAAAVAASTSWRGVLRLLALPERSSRLGRLLRVRCDELGVDYSHFRGQRRWTDDELVRSARSAGSWPQLLSALGYAPDSGSAKGTVRSHCARLGVDVSHLSSPQPPAAPPRLLVRPENLRKAGSMIVAATLTLHGYDIAWPLEPTRYDLLAEAASGQLVRVQVKTTTQRHAQSWLCRISRSMYDRRTGSSSPVPYDPDEIDYFAIVDGNLNVYFMPAATVGGRGVISLRKYQRFILAEWPQAPGQGTDEVFPSEIDIV